MQLGGGIRTFDDAAKALALGVSRVMLGTVAITQPELVGRVCRDLGPDAVVVSVDARDGRAAVSGWTTETTVPATELLERMQSAGVRTFLYTDISRDGTLTEPNYSAVKEMVKHANGDLIAAGGISTLQHLLRLAELGAAAAVVGTALYTGDIDLAEAIQTLQTAGD